MLHAMSDLAGTPRNPTAQIGAFRVRRISRMAGTARAQRHAGQTESYERRPLRSPHFILRCGVRGRERESRNETVSHVRCCGGGGLRRADHRMRPISRYGSSNDYRDRGTPSPPERVQRLLGTASSTLCQAARTAMVRLGRNTATRAPCRPAPKPPHPGGYFPVTLPTAQINLHDSDCGQAAPAHGLPVRALVRGARASAISPLRSKARIRYHR